MKRFRGWDATTWIAFVAAISAFLGAGMAFWQAREAHYTNEEIKRENQRSSPEGRVFLARSPAEITAGRPDALWSVWNQTREPIARVWAEAMQGREAIAWRLGDVDGCKIKGIGNTNIVVPQYLHWIDTDGQHWVRLNWQASSGDTDTRPQPDSRHEPSISDPSYDQSAGSIVNPNCS